MALVVYNFTCKVEASVSLIVKVNICTLVAVTVAEDNPVAISRNIVSINLLTEAVVLFYKSHCNTGPLCILATAVIPAINIYCIPVVYVGEVYCAAATDGRIVGVVVTAATVDSGLPCLRL